MSSNEQRLQNVTDLIRKQRYSYSQIEDDYQLLTEYVYDNPQSFDDFKHLLPEVTRQEIQGKREEAFAESEKMAAVEPEKGDPLETIGWTALQRLKPIPSSLASGLDALTSTIIEYSPGAYQPQAGEPTSIGAVQPDFKAEMDLVVSEKVKERRRRESNRSQRRRRKSR